jgi:hypothetical protein
MYSIDAVGMVELYGGATPPAGAGGVEALRDRQVAAIEKLEADIARVDAEIKKLGGTPTQGAGGGAVAMAKHGQARPDNSLASLPSAMVEVSVAAHPSAAPAMTLAVVKALEANGKVVDIKEYWHSSLADAERPDPATLQQERFKPRIKCDFRLNLFWKAVDTPNLVASSVRHIPIEGDANMVGGCRWRMFLGTRFGVAPLLRADLLDRGVAQGWLDRSAMLIVHRVCTCASVR